MSKELEYKFLISNNQREKIIDYLNEVNADYVSTSHQKDVYYIPKFRQFEINGETTECVRVRITDKGSVLCYKKIHRESNPIYCDEYETKIEDEKQLEKILLAIDFEVQMVIDKTRETYRFGDYEFAFDCVKDFGELLEVEYKGLDESKFDEIFDVLSLFDITKENITYEGIQKLVMNKKINKKGEV